MIFCEVWDKETRSLLGSFRTEREVLTLVRSKLDAGGHDVENLALASGDDEDEDAGGLVAEGRAVPNLLHA
ncbi:MAG: hypothetical protein IT307_16150 [Chloroflexi bacterium]|nr:hypothetical protein [Chloroflexota bacterium]